MTSRWLGAGARDQRDDAARASMEAGVADLEFGHVGRLSHKLVWLVGGRARYRGRVSASRVFVVRFVAGLVFGVLWPEKMAEARRRERSLKGVVL